MKVSAQALREALDLLPDPQTFRGRTYEIVVFGDPARITGMSITKAPALIFELAVTARGLKWMLEVK